MSGEPEGATHTLAWNGFSFEVPADWNLSDYAQRSDISRLRLQDDTALRLELEWRRTRTPMDAHGIGRRYAVQAEGILREGATVALAAGLPPGWAAYLYSMTDGRRLLTAFWVAPGGRFFAFFRLHFAAASRREPLRMIRRLAAGFRLHDEPVVPWAVYDIAFRLNREFRLVSTAFQAGRKMLAFEWRLRRFFLWYVSLPDLFLNGRAPEARCAEFLNAGRDIRGVLFEPGHDGAIRARHTWRRPFGHGEALARACFRYQARCRLLPEKRQLALWVFHYRRAADLAWLHVDVDDGV